MTLIQKIVTNWLPQEWATAVQAESESWLLRCPKCDSTRSVWEIGGVRYKGKSKGKRSSVWCAQCGQLRMMTWERKQDA
jgi:hypothetical protein